MKILIILLCATAAMDDCKEYRLSEPVTPKQCEAITETYTEVLGPASNYRLACEDA